MLRSSKVISSAGFCTYIFSHEDGPRWVAVFVCSSSKEPESRSTFFFRYLKKEAVNHEGLYPSTFGVLDIFCALHFQGTQSLIAFATVLTHSASVRAINLNRPILYSEEVSFMDLLA